LSEAKAVEVVNNAYQSRNVLRNPVTYLWRAQPAAKADVKLGPIEAGELLRVSLWDLTAPGVESTKMAQVEKDGTVSLPYVGSVKVGEQSEAAAEAAIAKAYAKAGLIQNAVVSVAKVNGSAKLPEDEPVKPVNGTKPPEKRAARAGR
jgi:protein involved in polysaccharide export with SLBB domain